MFETSLRNLEILHHGPDGYTEAFVSIARPAGFPNYRPGTCVTLELEGISRPYSIAISNDESNACGDLNFYVTLKAGGGFSEALLQAVKGTIIVIPEVFRFFPLLDQQKEAVYIAVGSGIAPLFSVPPEEARFIKKVVCGRRYEKSLVDSSIQSWRDHGTVFSFAYSREPRSKRAFLQDLITPEEIDEWLFRDYILYLCGREQVVVELATFLQQKRIASQNILTELFL